jgi:pimeloyl-ACP methyl ester carboxylesterase
MKRNHKYFKIIIYLLAGVLMVSSCRKDETPVYDHFVSDELVASYPATSINQFLDVAGQAYPEVNDIKPFITYDVNVYKMIYNTTINNEDLKVSGLVCIPATEGEYPVLSYQNGTNTLFSNAPSENPMNVSYELVEFISSMGFIVVLPDYPGFGESEHIPHPYLIKEPTVVSVVDMLRAVREACPEEFPGISDKDEYYLMGYSQGGWATFALHKALETEYSSEFNLKASTCGAGPYNMYNMFQGLVTTPTYPMPSYLGYIIYAYSAYDQFTNPVSDLLNEPYASRLSSLYNGMLSLPQINSQLTTSMTGLFRSDFISGFNNSPAYATIRSALGNNSVSAWNSRLPLLFVHGESDTDVSVTNTQYIYEAMMAAGTSPLLCRKILFPGLDHGSGLIPSMSSGLLFILDIRDN